MACGFKSLSEYKNKNSTRRNYWKEKIIRDLQNKMEDELLG